MPSIWEVASELSQIEAGNGFNTVVHIHVRHELNKNLDEVEVFLLMESDRIFLPELLGVNRTPSESSLDAYLLLEFVDG